MNYDRLFNIRISEEAVKLSRRFGLLPYMAERYIMMFGLDGVEEFLRAVHNGIPRSIRCNKLVVKSCGDLVSRLEKEGFKIRQSKIVPYGYYVYYEPVSLGSTVEHLLGYYFIQGIGSMASVVALSPQLGELVADLASAPGGKTTHIAQLMNNTGGILSIDVDARRLAKLVSNIERMHVRNVIVLMADILNVKVNEGSFDRVMLDAPCTGEGLIVYKKERFFTRTIDDLRKMSEYQLKLLLKAFKFLKPGGTMVYATCSIAPEENEFVITRALDETDEMEVIETRLDGAKNVPGITEFNGVRFKDEVKNCLRLYPHTDSTEGFFICLLKRKE
ncbi:MAG: RsmB/NOP family class I SAM-dependent RNA methyltransferase [Desulfurococcales archaeon]